MYKFLSAMVVLSVAGVMGNAQSYQRRASIVGGGGGNGGKCTIEVVVDGAAEVQINGNTATLRNLSGQPPQWRRFECTSPMPSNPGEFRFEGRDGRGRQELIRDPRNGGAAVVRIEDSDNGAEGYTFDIMWGNGRGNAYPTDQPRYGGGDRDRPSGRFSTEQAISVCRDAVTQRAAEMFGGQGIEFQETRLADNPGPNDRIVGRFFMRRSRDRDLAHRFVCSVNFDTGRVRSVQIDEDGQNRFGAGPGDRSGVRDAVQTCRGAVEDRVRQRGYRRVEIGSIQVDDRPGRNDWVMGSVRASRGPDWDAFDFTCRVNLRDGDVRSVDLTRR